jgi:hypothetical protein
LDFQTSLQLLLEGVHRTSIADRNRLAVSLVNSMSFHKHRSYWFNGKTYTDQMVTGQQEYTFGTSTSDVPIRILRIRVSQILVGDTWYDPMTQVPIGSIRDWTYADSTSLGYPDFYAIYDNKIFVYARPQDNFTWRLDYNLDIDRPRARYDGAWHIETRTAGDPTIWEDIPQDYENEWLQHAEPMIRAWAEWEFYKNYLNDHDNAGASAAYYREEESNLQGESNFFQQGNSYTRPTPL